jgi:GTP pyrophosphokinase
VESHPIQTPQHKKTSSQISGMRIAGADTFLTRIARCCKPIPSDEIVGYITQGRGVSIHRKNCSNIAHIDPHQGGRFLDVSWDNKQLGSYYVDLQVRAYGSPDLLKEITAFLTNLKINLISLNSTSGKNTNMMFMTITIQINELTQLNQLVSQLSQLPNIIDVKRIRDK